MYLRSVVIVIKFNRVNVTLVPIYTFIIRIPSLNTHLKLKIKFNYLPKNKLNQKFHSNFVFKALWAFPETKKNYNFDGR